MTTETPIILTAKADVTEGAADKPARVSILAYTGGPMRVSGFYSPVVIDLAGLEMPQAVPLLADHRNELGAVAGSGRPVVRAGKLHVTGELVRDSEAGRQAILLHKSNVALSASVGVEVITSERLSGGDKLAANGQNIVAPAGGLLVVRKGRLREISLTPVGADAGTQVSIAARGRTNYGGTQMSDIVLDENSIRADERQRLASIESACAGLTGNDVADLKARAIGGELSVAELKAELLDFAKRQSELAGLRSSRPTAPAIRGGGNEPATSDVLAAAVMLHTGQQSVAEKQYGAGVCQRADDLRARSLVDIAAAALVAEGRPVPRSSAAIVTAGFSSTALPIALGDAAAKVVLQSYADSPASWSGFANLVDVQDFKVCKILRPSFAGELQPVGAGGEIKHGNLSESVSDLSADTYAQILTIDRRDFINDDGQVFSQTAPALGRNAARSLSDCIFRVILANAGDFFDEGNDNLDSDPLDVAGLAGAIASMASQRDDAGRDLDVRPKVLLVPPELEFTARQLLTSEALARYVADGTDNQPQGNPLHERLTLAVEPRLSNAVRFAGASNSAWYLFAGPQDAGLNVAFLQGQRFPVVETFDVSHDPRRLAFTWRVYHDFGAGLGDFRAAFKSTGDGG